MGFGEDLYYATAERIGEYAYGLMLCLTAFVFLLYLLDADQWTSARGRMLLHACIVVVLGAVVLLVLLIADEFPYGMICLFAVTYPLWLLGLRLLGCYARVDARTYVSWLSGPLFYLSLVGWGAWIAWVFVDPDHEWNVVARVVAAERTGCAPAYEDFPGCAAVETATTPTGAAPPEPDTCFHVTKVGRQEELVFPEGCDPDCVHVYGDCLNGFILWIGPVLVTMTVLFLSFFCTFLRSGEYVVPRDACHAPAGHACEP